MSIYMGKLKEVKRGTKLEIYKVVLRDNIVVSSIQQYLICPKDKIMLEHEL